MPVVEVNEIVGRGARLNADGTRDRTRVFQVKTSSFLDDDDTVLAHASIPQLGTPHPKDLGCWVVALEPRESRQIAGGGSLWTVAVHYSSVGRPRCDDIAETDPLKMRPNIQWGLAHEDRVAQRCRKLVNDEPVNVHEMPRNTAGELFVDPLMKRDQFLTVQIIRNEAEWNPLKASEFVNTINNDEFEIDGVYIEPFSALLYGWIAEERYIGTCKKYYVHRYEIHIRPTITEGINDVNNCIKQYGWDVHLMNQGNAYTVDKPGGGKNIVGVRDAAGARLGSTIPLDPQGERQPMPTGPGNPPYTIGYRIYEEKAFKDLKLPKKGDR